MVAEVVKTFVASIRVKKTNESLDDFRDDCSSATFPTVTQARRFGKNPPCRTLSSNGDSIRLLGLCQETYLLLFE
jgi:hypothetical protein